MADPARNGPNGIDLFLSNPLIRDKITQIIKAINADIKTDINTSTGPSHIPVIPMS